MTRFAALFLAANLLAQAPPPPPPPPGPPTWNATSPDGAPTTFQVGTVKPNRSGSSYTRMAPSAGRLTLQNYTLDFMIKWAWGLKDYQLLGAPRWASSDRFDIDAKAYGAPDLGHLALLLRPLLLERFQMAVHLETRNLPAYALKVEPRGSKLHKPDADAAANSSLLSIHGGAQGQHITGHHATLKTLADILSRTADRPVFDQTGLAGEFQFQLDWLPENAPADLTGVSLFTALKEQLGLGLEATRAPVEVLVIDRVARTPLEN